MKLRTSLLLPLTVALVLGGGLGCKKPKPTASQELQGRAAVDIVDEGELLLKHKKWEEGRKTLRLIEEYLPSSKEFPRAKLLIADSFFFGSSSSYPEALVEYQSFLTYFPRHAMRDYALYHIGLCHYASIETAERDQSETQKALESFQKLLEEAPGSPYALDAKVKITQCWRRLAESELLVGIFYVNSFSFPPAEKRIKGALETYPEYIDRERAYFYLGEAMRRMYVQPAQMEQFGKDYLAKLNKDDFSKLTKDEWKEYGSALNKFVESELERYRQEAKTYYQKLVESYPNGAWAPRAKDRLIEMGTANVKEELDS